MDQADQSLGEMAARVARFADLSPLAAQRDATIPQNALDLIYSRKLLPVIRRDGAETAISDSAAPIEGAGGITITYACCPPGQGPGLHSHKRTFETFTVLQSSFEFRWGEEGETRVTLEKFDVISLPPGHARAFTNVGTEEGLLQVIISGGTHDANDLVLPYSVSEKLRDLAPEFHDRLAATGITFKERES